MKATVVNDTEFKIPEKGLKDSLKKISEQLVKQNIIDKPTSAKEVTLVFLGKLEAKKLNWQYRQKDYPTDILSFESVAPESLGELVFCPEVLQQQATEHKQTFEMELGLMLIHGVLHLLGFDHEQGGDDEAKMLSLQEAVFSEIFKPKAKAKRAKAKKA